MTRIGWFVFFTVISSSLFIASQSYPHSEAQVQDLSCPSCVIIPPEEIDLYESLFPLIIRTNSEAYDHNSIIFLKGHMRPENIFHPVTITVTNPIGNVVTIEQITPNQNGDFSVNFNTASPLWSQDGNYIIKAQSGQEPRVFKTQVQLISDGSGAPIQCELNEMVIHANNGAKYCLPYSATGDYQGLLTTLDVDSKTLSITIPDTGLDSLELQIPRVILDSKSPDGVDSDFIVMAGDINIEYEEVESTSELRIIKISTGTDQVGVIDIMGTSAIPEFGVITIALFAGSIAAVVFMSKRNHFIARTF